MSYPSIKDVVEKYGVNLQAASDEQLKAILLKAFQLDLSQGMRFLEKLAAQVKTSSKRLLMIESPNSPLGKQLIRLLGADISRKLVAEHFQVSFGFYNCCNVVCAPNEQALNMTMAEQIQLQNGALADADC